MLVSKHISVYFIAHDRHICNSHSDIITHLKGKGGNVTSAGWQVTLCDPIWHVSSRSGAVLVALNCYTLPYLPYLTFKI